MHPELRISKHIWDVLIVSAFLHWMESAFSPPGHSFLHKRHNSYVKGLKEERFQTWHSSEEGG